MRPEFGYRGKAALIDIPVTNCTACGWIWKKMIRRDATQWCGIGPEIILQPSAATAFTGRRSAS
jgi:hypothetical protein